MGDKPLTKHIDNFNTEHLNGDKENHPVAFALIAFAAGWAFQLLYNLAPQLGSYRASSNEAVYAPKH